MPAVSPLTDLLACPRCDKTPLTPDGEHYGCGGCKTEFPSVAGIPWLFAEPDSTLGEWRNRLHFELQRLAHDAERLKAELQDGDLRALTRQRLELQLCAGEEHRNSLRRLLAPLDVHSMQASHESYLALRTRLPADQGLHTYYANVHRDWAWGDEENAASLEQIQYVLKSDQSMGDTLVLGAGACRLAYDLHMQLGTTRTIAMDFNPLLLLIAKSVIDGGRIELHEFPIAPKTLHDVAVLRELRAPEKVRDGFFLILGDALRAPFRPGAFDTVVTPWLIDIVPEDLPILAMRINRLLKTSGRWINFGSVAFDHPLRARRYCVEETLAIAESAGFAAPSVHEANIPYMCSPASRHGRRETVLTFAAGKTDDLAPPPRRRALPDWIVTGKVPVPLTPSFRTQAVSTQIYAYIMSLIDGRRSLEDMAELLEKQKLMTREEAKPAIRNFLTRMYEDSERQRGL
ncbi:MAG: hypothetical protein ACREQ8_17670 [Woeseiaceae bacterium]